MTDNDEFEKILKSLNKNVDDELQGDENTANDNDFANGKSDNNAKDNDERISSIEYGKTLNDNDEGDKQSEKSAGNKKKAIIIAVVAVMFIVGLICGIVYGLSQKNEEEPETEPPIQEIVEEIPAVITNPLTGETGYNESAVGKRPISVAVDNASGARPQYNMNKADIVVEGEVEGGETRLLWFFADMSNLPDLIGPTRSARPSYVEFSQLFDSIFVHFGGSHSKGDYIGGYETISANNVNDIDGMSISSCFKRTSDKVSPHNAALLGANLVDAIEKKGYRKDIDESSFSVLNFKEKGSSLSDTVCNSVSIQFSSKTRTRTFQYNSTDKVYVNSSDYEATLEYTNIIAMYANSTYIDKENYKTAGNTETYLNYSLTSGSGKLMSYGTVVDFEWQVKAGRLYLTDMDGNELKLNPGKSWIGLVSSNHNGKTTIE